ncbi:hypothetical protein BGZ96_009860 [Linnemannia gamsii]|uniref:Uncharacterized protein n=1 Tax=Linnemannia gamsii TaxID=64522 RepID=A0ABQ7JXC1_9FUNG|nr:hypothetical protein BGZ96_009860 [Linnemannia gamsii]
MEQEQPIQLLHDNVLGADDHDNEDDGFEDPENMDMSASIVSFGMPDLDEIARQFQIAFLTINIALDNDDDQDDYVFVGGYYDDLIEEHHESSLDGLAWQVVLMVINGTPIGDDNGQKKSKGDLAFHNFE